MEAQKPKAKAKKNEKISKVRGVKNASLIILGCLIVTETVFFTIFGDVANFDGPDKAHAINIWGTIYHGGVIVPILQGLFLSVLVISVERFIAMSSAAGKVDTAKFVNEIHACLDKGDIEAGLAACKKQTGSVAAVVHATLLKYKQMSETTEVLTKEQKVAQIHKEMEEATALEMPSLQQNLPIVATMTSLGTLVGLLGTVIGMIKSFQALGQSGAPDSAALSAGISEALINTAFGIGTGACAIVSYSYYTNKIDNMTYAIDEVGFAIARKFAQTH
ncbi:MAG: MotA/TolQ/ExbB proton channel family protein [Bacteroidales bacterium]